MDEQSQANFDRITRLEPEALSEGDITFLKARRSYLTASDLERYAAVLGTTEPEDSAGAEQEAAPRKGKK